MFTTEQSFFIKILYDFINKEKTAEIPKNLSMEIIASYGKKHEIQAILYYQTKLPILKEAYYSTLYINTNRADLIQQLKEQFEFPYFIIKGVEIAELYPVKALRTMGDIDIVVHAEDMEKANAIFLNQGYHNKSKKLESEWHYSKGKMEFELHNQLLYTENVNDSEQQLFFNDCWNYCNNNQLDWNFHFLFLISHLRKHFMNKGVGFRQFMDIAIVSKYCELNWTWIEDKAAEIKLLPFLRIVLTFCNRWFGTTTSMKLIDITDEFFETSTLKIFEDGVFGFCNEENASSEAVNLYRKNGRIGMLKATLHQIFPRYREMKVMKEYAFIDGKPFLLPVAWMYRILIKGKNKKSVKAKLGKTFASGETIEKRKELYKQWGL